MLHLYLDSLRLVQVSQRDIDACISLFEEMNVNNDGFIDMSDLCALANSAVVPNLEHSNSEAKDRYPC